MGIVADNLIVSNKLYKENKKTSQKGGERKNSDGFYCVQ
jgi:hypothetical protein